MTYASRLITAVFIMWSLVSFGQQQSHFTITGQLSNAEGKKIYVAPSAQAVAIDSAVVHNGSFVLKGSVKEPDYHALIVEGKSSFKFFILSNANLLFEGNADSMRQASINGSKELEDAQALLRIIKPFYPAQAASFDSAFAAYDRGDTAKGKKYEKQNIAITALINDSIARFIKTHPDAYESLARLNEIHQAFGPERAKALFLSLSPSLQQHSVGKQLKYKIFEAADLTALNNKAITFEQRDTAGKLVSLSAYKGKYLLIDFWASWCLPCRAENPHIKEAYALYHDKGFEVLGVSLDNNKQAWLTAIRKDALPWTNVSDLNGFKNSVAQKYAVTELPTNYLLDPQGKIIARNLKGKRLAEVLQSVLGN